MRNHWRSIKRYVCLLRVQGAAKNVPWPIKSAISQKQHIWKWQVMTMISTVTIIVVTILYRDISELSYCIVIFSVCAGRYICDIFAMQARSIHHQSTQVSARFITCCEQSEGCNCRPWMSSVSAKDRGICHWSSMLQVVRDHLYDVTITGVSALWPSV